MILVGVGSSLFYKVNKHNSWVTLFAHMFWSFIIFGIAFGIGFAVHDNALRGLGDWRAWMWMVVNSICYILCIATWVQGIKTVPVSIAEPFAQIRMFSLLAVSWVLFSDVVTFVQVMLVGAIFVACVVMGYLQYRTERIKSPRAFLIGMMWLCLWVILSTINMTSLKGVVDAGVHVTTYGFITTLIPVAMFLPFFLWSRTPIIGSLRNAVTNKSLVGIGFCDNIWCFFYMPIVAVMNMGVLDAIAVTSTVLVVLCGVLLLKERIRWYIYPFIFVVIGCSIALSLLSG